MEEVAAPQAKAQGAVLPAELLGLLQEGGTDALAAETGVYTQEENRAGLCEADTG